MLQIKNNLTGEVILAKDEESSYPAIKLLMDKAGIPLYTFEDFKLRLDLNSRVKLGIGRLSIVVTRVVVKKNPNTGENNDHLGALGLQALPKAPKGAKRGGAPKRKKAR